MARIIACVDMDAFFASEEQRGATLTLSPATIKAWWFCFDPTARPLPIFT
jgi:hypothetical protein